MGAGLRNSKGPMSLGRTELCGLRSHGFGGGGGSLGGCDWKSDMFQRIPVFAWVLCREATETGGRQGSITEVQVGEILVGSRKLCWK